MKNIMRIGQCIIIVLSLYSCNQEDSEIGANLFDEEDIPYQLIEWDTISFKMSTVYEDSLVTSNTERLLIGKVASDEIGTYELNSFFKVSPNTSNNQISVTIGEFSSFALNFEKVTLQLVYDGYYKGDTTKNLDIEVFQVEEEMLLNDDGVLYNVSDFAVTSTALGSTQILPNPNGIDTVEIDLLPTIGEKVFEHLTENGYSMTNAEFKEILQGLKVQSNDAEAVIGFSSAILNIHYTDLNDELAGEKKWAFNINRQAGDVLFNQITSDKTGSLLEGIEASEEIGSAETKNKSFSYPGLGLNIKLEFPYLYDIYIVNPDISIKNAYLFISPIEQKKESLFDIFTARLRNDKYGSSTEYQNGFLDYDYSFSIDTRYIFDIEQYIEGNFRIPYEENYLFIAPARQSTNRNSSSGTENLNSTIDGVALADQSNNEYDTKIKLNVIILK